MGKPLEQAIIDAANQIVVPTLVATLCIAIVWLPLFELGGVAGYLFKPMAEAVIIAMLASFILSRTLVPTMAKYMMKSHHVASRMTITGSPAQHHRGTSSSAFRRGSNALQSVPRALRCAARTRDRPSQHLRHNFFGDRAGLPRPSFSSSGAITSPRSGRGSLQMHMRAPLGTRIEVSGRIATLVSNSIEELLPGAGRKHCQQLRPAGRTAQPRLHSDADDRLPGL